MTDVKSKLLDVAITDGNMVFTFEKQYDIVSTDPITYQESRVSTTIRTKALLPFKEEPNNIVSFRMTQEALEDLVALLNG